MTDTSSPACAHRLYFCCAWALVTVAFNPSARSIPQTLGYCHEDKLTNIYGILEGTISQTQVVPLWLSSPVLSSGNIKYFGLPHSGLLLLNSESLSGSLCSLCALPRNSPKSGNWGNGWSYLAIFPTCQGSLLSIIWYLVCWKHWYIYICHIF